jgi:hypothetical protein
MKGGQITPFGGSRRRRIKGGQITPFGGGSGSRKRGCMYGGGKMSALNPEVFAHEGMYHAKPESMVVAAPQKGGHRCKRGGSKRRTAKRSGSKRRGSKRRSAKRRSGSKRKTRKY